MLSFLSLYFILSFLTHITVASHVHQRDASKLSAGWYPGWRSQTFPVSDIPWSKYNHLFYAFGIPTPDPSEISLEGSGPEYISDFVDNAHRNNILTSISIGGWSGSRYFSSAVGSEQNRTKFVKALTDIVEKYDLDGLDFDWEFPNNAGVGCNAFSSSDVDNLLSLVQELRETPKGPSLILSAAVFVTPWNDTSGIPITNVSGFADVLDFIEIMNYDVFNLWAPVAGPNAPLNDTCAEHKRGSAVSAVDLWTKAGIPNEKIVLGIPLYARSFTVPSSSALVGPDNSSLSSFPPYNVADEQLGDDLDASGLDVCGVMQVPTGLYTYQGLVDKGQLFSNGSIPSDMVYKWDECSQTPFLYNTTSEVYISYDDPQSLALKGSFISDMGLKGFAAWDITMDHETRLVDSISSAMRSASSLGTSPTSDSAQNVGIRQKWIPFWLHVLGCIFIISVL